MFNFLKLFLLLRGNALQTKSLEGEASSGRGAAGKCKAIIYVLQNVLIYLCALPHAYSVLCMLCQARIGHRTTFGNQFFSFTSWILGNQTQVISLAGKHLYPLNHFTTLFLFYISLRNLLMWLCIFCSLKTFVIQKTNIYLERREQGGGKWEREKLEQPMSEMTRGQQEAHCFVMVLGISCCTPLIPAISGQRQVDSWIFWGLPGLKTKQNLKKPKLIVW